MGVSTDCAELSTTYAHQPLPTTGDTVEKIKQRIRKLLAQAEDRQGTPEGDAFYNKAFELIADYGIERSELESEESDIGMRMIAIHGNYSSMQATLLLRLAETLHCVGFNTGPRPSRIYSVTLFGRRQHLERVELLYSILCLTMLNGASRVYDPWSLVKARRSFMMGFISRICERLAAAEDSATESVPGYGLVLVDDTNRANRAKDDFLSANNIMLREVSSRAGFVPNAFDEGWRAGNSADIGQSRIQGQREIEAPF